MYFLCYDVHFLFTQKNDKMKHGVGSSLNAKPSKRLRVLARAVSDYVLIGANVCPSFW